MENRHCQNTSEKKLSARNKTRTSSRIGQYTKPKGESARRNTGAKKTYPATRHLSKTSAKRKINSEKNAAIRKTTSTVKKKTGNKIMVNAWIAAGIVAILALCVIFSRPKFVKSDNGDKVPIRGYKFAIDLSHHNTGEIVWDSLRVMIDKKGYSTKSVNAAVDIYPVSYVILKATEGNNLKDRKFKKNWEDAKTAGYRRGAYHFFRSSKKPATQAENFIKTVGHLDSSDLPPILDIETIHKGYSVSKLNASIKVWLDIVEKHYGRKPIIYSSESFIKDILDNDIRNGYPLWVARYREAQPDRKDWTMWQFTDKAVVYGVEGNVDLNAVKNDAL